MGRLLYLLFMGALSGTVVYIISVKLIIPFLNKVNRKETLEELVEVTEDNKVLREVKVHTHLENKQDEILNKLTQEK